MIERRPATTIGELDIHLGHVMEEIRTMREKFDTLATRDEVSKQIAALEAKIAANTPRSFLRVVTEIAAAVTLVAAAVGVIVAVARTGPT